MRLETWVDTPPVGWDDTVRRLDGTVFHTSAWAEYQQATRRVRPIFVLGRDESGDERAAAVALLRVSSRPIASLLLRDLSLSAHPAIGRGGGVTAAAFLRHCETLARSWGCSRVRVDSFMSGASPLPLADLGYREQHRVEFCVDLESETSRLWQAIRKDQRERIRRLQREGARFQDAAGAGDLGELRLTRETTQARRQQRGQGYELSNARIYDDLHRLLVKRDAGRLLVARIAGEPAAAIFFATFNGRACSIFSGSTDAGYRLGAQSGLYWMAVETFKAEGYRQLNRGGVPASAADESDALHGIYQFKLRLGTTPTLCRSGEKVVSPVRHGLRLLAGRLRNLGGEG